MNISVNPKSDISGENIKSNMSDILISPVINRASIIDLSPNISKKYFAWH